MASGMGLERQGRHPGFRKRADLLLHPDASTKPPIRVGVDGPDGMILKSGVV
jgi:hypothetical protein